MSATTTTPRACRRIGAAFLWALFAALLVGIGPTAQTAEAAVAPEQAALVAQACPADCPATVPPSDLCPPKCPDAVPPSDLCPPKCPAESPGSPNAPSPAEGRRGEPAQTGGGSTSPAGVGAQTPSPSATTESAVEAAAKRDDDGGGSSVFPITVGVVLLVIAARGLWARRNRTQSGTR